MDKLGLGGWFKIVKNQGRELGINWLMIPNTRPVSNSLIFWF